MDIAESMWVSGHTLSNIVMLRRSCSIATSEAQHFAAEMQCDFDVRLEHVYDSNEDQMLLDFQYAYCNPRRLHMY